ncbi:MAG: amidohydrolase [Bacteroidetes bacterium]|nr:amidohydrolase [Bacteroidota bacterium]MBS1920970.1 amidohydrolase [Bacteroidota bacterium]
MNKIIAIVFMVASLSASAQKDKQQDLIKAKVSAVEKKVIAWRRDFHEHPELSNREVRTADIVAKHLQSLGLEVKTGIAKTGVVGLLKGGLPGPIIALRADMDGLPVYEKNDLPFASKVETEYNGQKTGVMHACGHDSHVAMLMGVAEVLSSMKKDLKGTVKFIFQPAEEGAPAGEEGGAELMVKEGVLDNPKVDVIFGLHISAGNEVGTITYRPGGEMAGVNDMQITVIGKPSHGAAPWQSVDPILVSAQIINSLQSVVSRNVNITENPAVVTVGAIHGGNRTNIISEKVEMLGTIRTFSAEDEKLVIGRITNIATKTAEAAGATALVKIPYSSHYPVTFNNIALTNKMLPSLHKSAGAGYVAVVSPRTGSEDFSFFAEKVPGLFLFLGGMPKGTDPGKAPSHHTPGFFIDESGFSLGVLTLCNLVVDYANLK